MNDRQTVRSGSLITAALISLAACTTSNPLVKPADSVQPSTQPSTDTDGSSPDQRHAGRTKPQELGVLNKPPNAADAGAPFDPCALPWTAFPEAVRPSGGTHTPTLRRPDSPQWTVQCDYDNSGSIKVDVNGGGSTGPEGGYLIITVAWAKDGKADPTSNPGAQAKSWGGKSGFVLSQPDDPRFGQLCMSSVKLSTGSGVTLVSNSRFKSQTSACAIADASAAAIGAMSH
jgi:hypothetical protein